MFKNNFEFKSKPLRNSPNNLRYNLTKIINPPEGKSAGQESENTATLQNIWIKIDLACDKFVAEEFEKAFSCFFQWHHRALGQLRSKRKDYVRGMRRSGDCLHRACGDVMR